VQDHAAVGGEAAVAVDAEAGVRWRAVGEFVLRYVSHVIARSIHSTSMYQIRLGIEMIYSSTC
jgi:hypothetical protein